MESISQSETDSSVVISESDVESGLDPLLLESDNFSETASEFQDESSLSEAKTEESEPTGSLLGKKRRRTKHLAYQRKFDKKKTQASEPEEVEDEDIDILDVSEESSNKVNPVGEKESSPSGDGNGFAPSDKVSTDPNPTVLALMNNLKLLLPSERWCADVLQNRIVRLIHHNDSKNAVVDLCLFWDCEKNIVGVFVNGIPVPSDNKIFLSRAFPITENIGSVSDYLSFMANNALKSVVCSGITEFKELWEGFEGIIERWPTKSPCYRSAQCSILVGETDLTCKNCRCELEKLRRENQRQERRSKQKEKEKKFHAPDDSLTFEDMKGKKDKWKSKFRVSEKRADRLKKRVNELQLKLDKCLRDDLLGILNANQHKMTPIQRLFWESQKAALCAKDKRGLRWHPMMIRVALKLHSDSPGNYQFLRDSTIMCLPSDRTLYDYSHFVDPKEGCQSEIIAGLREKIKKKGSEDFNWFINLMFDEMHIRSGLVTKRSTGELIGYTNLSTVDEELEKLQLDLASKNYKPKLAKKVLVYFAQGLANDAQDVVAIYSTDDLSASQLYDRTWQVIYYLEEAGIRVLCLTCDGAAVNRKFIRMHPSFDRAAQEIYCSINLASGDGRMLFFIVDPPHLLKTIRNALANSFSHRKTRQLWKNGQLLSWKVMEKLYEVTKHDKHVNHKLTKSHITLSSFSCMTVLYATQALSNSVASSIEQLANHEAMSELDTEELIKFIRIMNKFFDCVNGKQEDGEEVRNPNLAAYTSSNDPRLEWLSTIFLDYFEDWKKDIKGRPGIFSATERAQMIISYQALESVQITVKSIVGVIKYMLEVAQAPKINARVLNQDPLEQYFGKVRRKLGDNRHPTLKATLDTSFSVRAQGQAAMPTKKGNTQVLQSKEGLSVDDSPLPKRPKKM